ncbi:tagatose-bisphosphate aldolase subunit KbaY, partial [Candidatus Nomurabacteria bacterium]|nr:tagatose-bisphosphate aldolase subunit KbaY [Candidatus Nomurabacteria bacterium]
LTDYCSPRNIPVEAELGIIGGKEDDLVNGTVLYTDPSAAETFASVTGITSLAVAIGTAHGFYKTVPELDLGRLIEIRSKVRIPLVMHGASGLTDEQIKSAVVSGISKVNFATELRAAFTYAVREHLASHPDAYDPKTYLSAGRKAVFELVREKIGVLGWQM